ncbi:osmC-like family protein [Mycobacterium xenopi 3993]|nr:osmC-like family protein [Mycobacterium xenopi 3993]
MGRTHRGAPLYRAQLTRRAGTRRFRGRRRCLHPGELLKIALAACSGMATDQPLARRLGDDYKATIRVSGAADRQQERYPLLEETLEVDLSGLTEAEAERLLVVVNRAVDQACTVGRTLKSGTTVKLEIADGRA